MKKNVFIITGTSRGIGEHLTRQLMNPDNILVCISRNESPRLHLLAEESGCELIDISANLSHTEKIPEMVHHIMRNLDPAEIEELVLVNNAGTIHPVKAIGSAISGKSIQKGIHVNLLAPILLTERFVAESNDWGVKRKVLNITSGAAQRTIPSWSNYCTAKAGLNMYTQCLADEQAQLPNGIKAVAFAPGVVDTEMQSEIRETVESDFPDRQRFVDLKEQGELLSPRLVAKKIIELLRSPDFGKETIIRIDA